MEIRVIPIDRINAAAYNPRIDLQPGDPEYEKLRRSIEEFGYVEPIVWNARNSFWQLPGQEAADARRPCCQCVNSKKPRGANDAVPTCGTASGPFPACPAWASSWYPGDLFYLP